MIIIGHRGAMAYEPENTLLSFKKAIEQGLTWVELDIYIVDGKAIVFHDARLERTTNGKGKLLSNSFKSIRQLDAGKGEQIPTLEELLDCLGPSVTFNIELKGPNCSKVVADIIKSYISKPNWSLANFLVSSFDHEQLEQIQKVIANVRIGVMLHGMPIGKAKSASALNAYSVHQKLEYARKDFIEDALSRNLKVFIFTVNEIDDIELMLKRNVTGIFTDYPDRTLKYIASRG